MKPKSKKSDMIKIKSKNSIGRPSLTALTIQDVHVNSHCIGNRWVINDIDCLARLIAIMAMGQATHAARILLDLQPSKPALNLSALREDAKKRLSLSGETAEEKKASRWHRDGLIFEAISWIAANQDSTGDVLLKDPHISATTQGLDGLMIELDADGTAIKRVTIFEDKCSKWPRDKFRDEVMPTFRNYHANERASELVATAAALIANRMEGTSATEAAARVLDRKYRAYRAGLTIDEKFDNDKGRAGIFKDYDTLDGIQQKQRIAGTFVLTCSLRDLFENLALCTIGYIEELGEGEE